MRYIFTLLLLFNLLAASTTAEDFIWIESETPTTLQGLKELNAWGHDYISGTWANISVDADKLDTIDGDAVLLKYDFESPAGTFELWNRVGFEYVRSPFDWRIDGGDWKTASPDDLTIDLMEIGFWCEIAWLKLGNVPLQQGKHTLEIRIAKRTKPDGKPDRILYASDCICLHAGQFNPYSKYKPNEDHQTDKDREAAKPYLCERSFMETLHPLLDIWEICRDDEYLPEPVTEPISKLPETTRWSAIEVPGDKNELRPDLTFAHRVWYRKKIDIPAKFQNYCVYLQFEQNNLNTTVYVNGQLCGFNKNPFVPFRIDISKAIKPGEVNEIYVGIRDAWYAFTEKADDPMKLRKKFNLPKKYFGDGFQDLVYPIWNHPQSGILDAPMLVFVKGPVYVDDVFVKPSVANKELTLDVTLKNTSDQDQTVEIDCSCSSMEDKTKRAFKPKTVTVKANSELVVPLTEKFANPKLWTPETPHLYDMFCGIYNKDGTYTCKVLPFGFREWSIDGKDFLLNGVPFHGWADCFEQPTKEKWLQFYRESNQTVMRFWGTKWQGMTPTGTLHFFDENGVAVRRSGIFDGEAIGYNAIENDPELRAKNKAEDPSREEIKMDLFRNWRDQMVAQVKAERNHPSVMLWSLENEILYINCINLYGGLMDQFEDEIIKTAKAVKEVDPTRPSMVDGGGATKRGNPGGAAGDGLEVHGDHYVVENFTKYPDRAYEPFPEGGGRGRWIWDENRPRFIGEDFYVNGYLPADFASIGGEEAFQGRTGARKAVGTLYRMLTEGYRWNGYGAWQFWLGQDRAVDQYSSNAPIAVFCKEYDWTFQAGATVERTLRIFNDTMNDETIQFSYSWKSSDDSLKFDSTAVSTEHKVPAGKSVMVPLTLNIPSILSVVQVAIPERGECQLIFTLTVKGKEVFRDTKEVSVVTDGMGHQVFLAICKLSNDPRMMPLSVSSDSPVVQSVFFVYDPAKSVFPALQRWSGFPPHVITDLNQLEAQIAAAGGKNDTRKILLIGKDAITPETCDSTALQAFAAQGHRVIVLEQKHPLRYSALPCEMETATNEGRIGFMENESHPVFFNLKQKDFFTWADGHVLYRDAYKKPIRGAKSLLQCDHRLENAAVVEVPVGKGVMILSQLLIGEKLEKSVVARQLLGNLINYAAEYQLNYVPVVVCTEGLDKNFAKELDAMQLKYTMADSLSHLLDLFHNPKEPPPAPSTGGEKETFPSFGGVPRSGGVVSGEVPDRAGWSLLDNPKSTWIIAATPKNINALLAMPDLDKFYQAGGTILLHGLTPDGLVDYNKLVGVDHMIREFRRERVGFPLRRSPLTQGLSLSDLAMSSGQRIFGWASDEFVASDTYSYVVDLEDVAPFATYQSDFVRMMSNGMVSADGWPYIVNVPAPDQPPLDFALKFPKKIELGEVTWTGNLFYYPVTKFGLFFDGKADAAQLFDVEPNTEPQTFAVEPTLSGTDLTLRLAEWTVLPDKGKTTGLDNIELKQKRPADFAQKVQPLINVGAMVHYPKRERGGIVLCNLNFLEQETVPLNAVKKRSILSAILRNLGAEFVETQTVIAGTPMQSTPINIAEKCNGFRSERGWLDNDFTFEAMPQGKQNFGGVTFDIYAFPTSPVPDCVIVREQGVEGIAVKQKADALFFLHTMKLDARRNRDEIRDGKLFETLKYVVHYDDGATEEVPIYAELDIEHYRQKAVSAIPGAMLGWVRQEETTGESAVAYIKQWNNPHPEKAIATIDIVRGKDFRGPAAVLGITAAKRE